MKNLDLAIAWSQTCILIEDVAILYAITEMAKYFNNPDILWGCILVLFNTIPKVLRENANASKKSIAKEIADSISAKEE